MFRSCLVLEDVLEKSHFCVFSVIAFESSSIVLFVAVLQILKIVYAMGNPLGEFIYSSFFLAQFISHADTHRSSQNIFIAILTNLTKCDIFGQVKVLNRLATLWPVINTAQRRQDSPQLRWVKTTKKPPMGYNTSSSSGNIYLRSATRRQIGILKWQ